MSEPGVQSVERALDLLEILAELGGDAGLSELSEQSGLPLPTIHRLMRTLVARGYARRLPSRRYALGARVMGLGDAAGRQLGAGARRHLARVARELGETANLAMLDGDMAVYVAQAASSHSMRMFTEVGRRVHLHSTGVGKALLGERPDAAVREIASRAGLEPATDRTITDVDALVAAVGEIRERGYAVDDGEQEIGVRCFAVPVPDAPSLTAISVSGPGSRLTLTSGSTVTPLLKRVARDLAAELEGEAAG